MFTTTVFDYDTIRTRLRQQAYLTKGITITLYNEFANTRYRFFFEGGIESYVHHLNRSAEPIGDDVFYVEGDRAARLVSVTDLKDPDSLFSLFQRLRAMGVIDELLRNGVEPGSEVVIGGLNFTYGEGMS